MVLRLSSCPSFAKITTNEDLHRTDHAEILENGTIQLSLKRFGCSAWHLHNSR